MASHFGWLVLGGCLGSLLTVGVLTGSPTVRDLAGGALAAGRASPSPASVPSPSAPASPTPATRLPSNGQLIANATVWVTPPQTAPTCVVLAPGELTALVHLARPDPEALVTFSFAGEDAADPAATMRLDVGADPQGSTVALQGGRYCYGLNNWGPITDNPQGTPIRELGQDVVLQLAWSPPSRTP